MFFFSLRKTNSLGSALREFATLSRCALFSSSDFCKTYFRYLNSSHWWKSGKSTPQKTKRLQGNCRWEWQTPFLAQEHCMLGLTSQLGLRLFAHNDKPAVWLMNRWRLQQVDLKLRSCWVPITFPSPKGTIPTLLASEKTGWLKLTCPRAIGNVASNVGLNATGYRGVRCVWDCLRAGGGWLGVPRAGQAELWSAGAAAPSPPSAPAVARAASPLAVRNVCVSSSYVHETECHFKL